MNASFQQQITRQHQRSVGARFTRLVVLLLVALSAPITIMAWFDSALVLSMPWRWLAFILACAAILRVILAGARSLRRADQRTIIADMDAHSDLPSGYVISTSAQFAQTSAADPTEHALLTRLHTEAQRLAATARPLHPWPGRYLVGAAIALVLLAAVLLGSRGAQPFLRMIQPWQPLPYTRVTLLPVTGSPAKHEAFLLEGSLQGRIPAYATVLLDNGQSFRAAVEPDGSFALAFANGIAAPAVAVAVAGADGRSNSVPLALRATPARTGYAHQIIPPAYTGQERRVENRPSFALLRASVLRFSVAFDTPPTAVRMVFDTDRAPLDLRVDRDDPLVWHADLQRVARTFGYHLEVSDAEGTYPVEEQPQQIVALPDKPPTIEITGNNGEDLKSREDILSVEFFAQDDIGLANLNVRYYRVGDPEAKSIRVAAFSPMTLNHEGQWLLELGDLAVRPMDLVVVLLEARDANDVDGPGIAISEPLIIEIPAFGEDEDEDSGEEGGGGGEAEMQEINPLVLQRQLYRDTLRLSLRLSSTAIEDLIKRQDEVYHHLLMMAESELAQQVGPAFIELINTAAQEAEQAANALVPSAPMGMGFVRRTSNFSAALDHQAKALEALLEAARLQMELEPQEAEEGEESEGDAGEVINYTLIGQQAPPAAADDADEEERIARALLALQEALEQQQQLNSELDEAGQEPGEATEEGEAGEPGQPGTPSEQGEPGEGEGEGGMTPGESEGESASSGGGPGGESTPDDADPSQSGTPPQTLAERQFGLEEFSRRIEQQIEQLREAQSGADPQLAAEQMRRAAEFQREAAEAILGGSLAEAAEEGARSEEALRRAMVLTESLLDRSVQSGIEAQSHAAGYQNLIRNYSRRLSYDQ